MTMMSLEVVIGGMTQRPRVVDGQIEAREVLDLTIVIDHNVVDGAPATRFAAQLRELIETAAVISSSGQSRYLEPPPRLAILAAVRSDWPRAWPCHPARRGGRAGASRAG